ncbi:MAG TPA: class I SAM-dependent methyltransferase [Actinokineospora sp.]|nr:class I SAM-dependent methyltransferase [Actinokineospora sp.]
MTDGVRSQSTEANLAAYSSDEVAGYLRYPYHRVRLDLAIGVLRSHLGMGQAPLIADIGAGGGQASELLAAHGFRPIACDAVLDAGRTATRAGLLAVGMDATGTLPFRSGSLDGILAGEIIEHVFDPAALLRECARVLRPGGVLVLTTPNLAPLQDRLRFLAGRAPRQVDPFHDYLYLHIRPFTYPLLAKGLRLAGLVPDPPLSNFVLWRSRFGEVSSRWAARHWPTLGGSLIVGAVRPSSSSIDTMAT